MDRSLNHGWLRWLARAVLVILVLLAAWLIVNHGENWLQQISAFTWHLRWLHLSASVLLLCVSYYLVPFGWVILAGKAGSTAGSRELRAVWFTSQLGRYIPGKVWLFAGRAAFLKSRGLTGYRATSVPFLELIYTAAGAGLAALPAIMVARGSVFSSPALRSALTAAGVSILLIPFLRPLQRRLYRLRHGQAPQDLPLPGASDSLMLLLFYSCIWWSRGLSLYLWLSGFGMEGAGLAICFAAAPLSWVAGYIVFLVPGGIGIREAVATAMVAPTGGTGPVLAVIAGQRLILSIIELSFALAAAGRVGLIGRRKEQ